MLNGGIRASLLGLAAVCCFLVSAPILQETSERNWWLVFLLLVAGQLLCGRAAAKAAKKHRQQNRELAEDRLHEDPKSAMPANSKAGPSILYLRPFSEEGKQRTAILSTGFILSPTFWTNYGWVEFEGLLARACSGRLVALGGAEEVIGPVRIKTLDLGWRARFSREARQANAIVVLPSSRRGTAWEIEWLKRNNLLSKTIFFMPSHLSEEESKAWTAAAASLSQSGIQLPSYEVGGAYFTLSSAGEVNSRYATKDYSIHALRDIIYETTRRGAKQHLRFVAAPIGGLALGTILGLLFSLITFQIAGALAFPIVLGFTNLAVRTKFTIAQALGMTTVWANILLFVEFVDISLIPHWQRFPLPLAFGSALALVAYRTRARMSVIQSYIIFAVWFFVCLAGTVAQSVIADDDGRLLSAVWLVGSVIGSYTWMNALAPVSMGAIKHVKQAQIPL